MAAGAEVFVADCARCHGTYGPGGAYPHLLVLANEVGTDPLLAQHFWANGDAVDWFNASFFGRGARYEVYEGYVAPLLDSSLRPARWAMSVRARRFRRDGGVVATSTVMRSVLTTGGRCSST